MPLAIRSTLAATFLATGFTLLLPHVALAESRAALGWVERGIVYPEGVTVKFKLDTGALTSSLHGEDVEYFRKDGEKWVRFDMDLKDVENGKRVESRIERKLERELTVRGAGGTEDRPVVRMKVCIGGQLLTEEFSLNDRDDMNYPVLLGRRTLEKLAPVDSGRTFTVEPACEGGQA
ncbi:ATP-dependent zinc protease family protein [Pseudomonas oligotrophica]|uniref:retropepsin-like aspartic peptidase RloA3 n=1 Tax=Pseudomonas oligotrophica TaxID=2912055 RepID=UPI001F32352E|nr:RimK/LysX family protein [Pseudomonas oligotrophica]MCF7201980.1 RimK/LysX family protein [Pseudomonas oligotrophica]